MYCEKCKSKNLTVLDSRRSKIINAMTRRRVCNDCGNRFMTLEVPKLEYDELEKENEKLKRAIKALEKII